MLFAVYVLLYGGFIFLAVFRPDVMESPAIGGVNVAITYGMVLIGAVLFLRSSTWSCAVDLPARVRRGRRHDVCAIAVGRGDLWRLRGGRARPVVLSRPEGAVGKGYFAAHGGIHWFVNGIAFAGDYLSAASFLGICGMIAFFGYDGFLYSIGYLAGWIVALFVIAEPLKRLGRFTFADALDSRFDSRGIKVAAAVSTLVVSSSISSRKWSAPVR